MKVTQVLNRRQARWAEFIAQFDFKIIYQRGTAGGKPDVLLRGPEYRLKEVHTPHAIAARFRSGQVDMAGRPSQSIVISVCTKIHDDHSLKSTPDTLTKGFAELHSNGNHHLYNLDS